jgi:S-disulfanyl-L-cysteine oxidoreductase SoxD
MGSYRRIAAATVLAMACGPWLGWAQSGKYQNVGRTPSAAEIKEWDIAIGPSGKELPSGSGTAKEGAALYATKCAACHGPDLAGANGPALRGGEGTMTSLEIERSIGSYWGFATTVWDFINRDMPLTQARGTLKPDEVYAITAFLLFKNGIIQETDVMDAKTLPKVKMPNRNNFIPLNPEYHKDAVRPYGSY